MLRSTLTVLVAALALWSAVFALYPLQLPVTPFAYDLKSGSSLRSVAHDLKDQGVLWEPWSFILVGRLLGQQGKIKAGNYEWSEPLTALQLLNQMTRGDTVQSEIKLIEGMNFSQFRAVLDSNEDLRHLTRGLSEQDILKQLGGSESAAEGQFFPDTYFFDKGGSDLDIMKRAHRAMTQRLNSVWSHRAEGLPYDNPYQVLIMASIIEKETGKVEERPVIAAVFINRLHQGMKLQTDPTVIYGMGRQFDGNVRKRDLLTDTPYNTYTRAGLPPTPIAMPSLAALESAVHPVSSNALYFVAKGDGSHQFSATLEEHNKAVVKYQLKHHGS